MTTHADWLDQTIWEHRQEQADEYHDETPTPDDWFWDEYGDAEKAWKE